MNNLSASLHLFPEESKPFLSKLSKGLHFDLKIKKNRVTKLGDFKYPKMGSKPVITLNNDQNQYRLLITYLHELAHLLVWINNKSTRDPHGKKWKNTFANLLTQAIKKDIFPKELREAVLEHSLNPKASSHSDIKLLSALKAYDPENQTQLLLDLPLNQLFILNNGKIFQKGELRRTRILCKEVSSRRKYLIHAHAEVTAIE